LGDFGIRAVEMGERVKYCGLTANAIRVDVSACVYVSASVEEQTPRVEKTVFGGDMQKGCASQTDVPTRRAAIQFRVTALHQTRVSIKHHGEIARAVTQQREDTGHVIPRVAAGSEEKLDARAETFRMARVRLDDIVERRAWISGVSTIGVRTVIEKPLERLWLKILARREQHGEPAPAQSVHVRAVADQKVHHRNPTRLRLSLERHVIDQDLPKFGLRRQEIVDAREVIGANRLPELIGIFEGFDVLFKFRPARESVLPSDLKLRMRKSGDGAGSN